jgi:hypothetical protein
MAEQYGTVMIARLSVPFEQAEEEARRWVAERSTKRPGFVRENLMRCDDGVTVIMTIVFESKEAYLSLSDDPEQDRWYSEVMRPMMAEDPQWFDGHWAETIEAP